MVPLGLSSYTLTIIGCGKDTAKQVYNVILVYKNGEKFVATTANDKGRYAELTDF